MVFMAANCKLNVNVGERFRQDEDKLPLTTSIKPLCFRVLTSVGSCSCQY